MTVKLKGETTVTFAARDVLAMITENVCNYSSFADMAANYINQNEAGDFEVSFSPKPESDSE